MTRDEHAFSIVMSSRDHVRRITVCEESRDNVLLEGVLGELQGLRVVDGVMLEIIGANGVLRIDLTEPELRRALVNEGSKGIRKT